MYIDKRKGNSVEYFKNWDRIEFKYNNDNRKGNVIEYFLISSSKNHFLAMFIFNLV